jgi:hypothetical protein
MTTHKSLDDLEPRQPTEEQKAKLPDLEATQPPKPKPCPDGRDDCPEGMDWR